MKHILSIGAGLLISATAFATGPLNINTPQSGVVNFTTNGSAYTYYTNVFPVPFTYPPVMSTFLTSGPTNALPLTNTVTATNFILSINTPTNATVTWTANPASAIIQSGSQAVLAGTPTNITFPNIYAYTPNVVVSSSLTNGQVGVGNITATNFQITVLVNSTVQWISFGQDYAAGTQTVTH